MSVVKYTIRDLARDAGVSITTVSRYMNQDFTSMSEGTRNKLRELVEQTGYSGGKARAKLTIAVVIPSLSDPFFAQILEGVERCADVHHFDLQLCVSGESFEKEKRCIKGLLHQNVSGIVYMSTVSVKENCYAMLKEAQKPFVVLDSYLSEYNVPALVFSNGVYGMYEATRHLVAKGHTEIMYISGLRCNLFEHHRYQGYVNALLDAGLTVDPELVRFTDAFSVENGSKSFESLYATGKRFTAVICENDLLALGVYKACGRLQLRVPDDLSVIGYNNTIISELSQPSMSSVDQHIDQLTGQALDMLMKQIKGEPIDEKIVRVAPSLILRDSIRDLTAEGTNGR